MANSDAFSGENKVASLKEGWETPPEGTVCMDKNKVWNLMGFFKIIETEMLNAISCLEVRQEAGHT